MAREPLMYRDNLEQVKEAFPDGQMIPVLKAGEWLGVDADALKKDKSFPLKKIGGRYYVCATGLARYMSETV